MKKIELTQGKFAIVDDADYEWLSQWKWHTRKSYNVWYVQRGIYRNGKCTKVLMHRQIMGAMPGVQVDHINGNGLDNRRCNLRFCTNAQNAMNQRKTRGSSRFKGVHWREDKGGKWAANIKMHGKKIFLGHYADEIDAARAYDNKARELFGEFALLNGA